jgi:SAM-dependent methyltransferase
MPDLLKSQQAQYYDGAVDAAFEINRPHGQPTFYRYLMEYKVLRAVGLLRGSLQGKTVLVSCCGSGMDAELLTRLGARVAGLDISRGALRRAAIRMELYGTTYTLVQGDVENLPFVDAAFDFSFVHDGLHHLIDPQVAIREMARVARLGVIITEPANAALTRLLIRLGMMNAYEEAGNLVVRLDAEPLCILLKSLGFGHTAFCRYLVKYGHPPGRWLRLFDGRVPFTIIRGAFLILGVTVFGSLGNKLSVVGERD